MSKMLSCSGVVLALALGTTAGAVLAVEGGPTLTGPEQARIGGHAVNPVRVLVKLAEGNSAAGLGALVDAKSVRSLPATGVTIVELRRGGADAVQAAIDLLEASGRVEYAEPDYLVSVDLTPNDSRFAELWGMENTGQTGGTPGADIDATLAWDMRTASDGVVMVIDTGVDYTHRDLSANMWTNPGEVPGNGLDDDGNGYVDDVYGINAITGSGDPMDDHDHGTHVSGTIGATGNNRIGVVGVNWSTQIAGCKFLNSGGSGSTSDAIICLEYAIDMKDNYGVDLRMTSNSWGGGGFSQGLSDAIAASGADNMLFIAAAGNNGSNTDVSPHYPSSYDLDNVVSVASTTHDDALSSFSNYGLESVDLGAPGSGILSTIPGNAYATFNGTSMATPHVSGAAMLAWTQHPASSALEIKEVLMSTVDPIPALDGKTVTGGRLNVYGALSCDNDNYTLSTNLGDDFVVNQDVATTVVAKLQACTRAHGATMEASFSNGNPTIALLDDGVAPDETADDGLYSGEWLPMGIGPVTMTVDAMYEGADYQKVSDGQVVAVRSADVKVNDEDGILRLQTGDPVSVDVWFEAAEQVGDPGEYFLGIATPGGIFWLDADMNMSRRQTPYYAGPQFSISDMNLLSFDATNGVVLYLWLIDTDVNGRVDFDSAIWDFGGYYASSSARRQPSAEAVQSEVKRLMDKLLDQTGK